MSMSHPLVIQGGLVLREMMDRRTAILGAAGAVAEACGGQKQQTILERLMTSTRHRYVFDDRTFTTSADGSSDMSGTLLIGVDGEVRDPASSDEAWLVVIGHGDHIRMFSDVGIDSKPIAQDEYVGFMRVTRAESKSPPFAASRRGLITFNLSSHVDASDVEIWD